MSGIQGPGSATTPEIDRRHMAEALSLACAIPTRPWPNPPVGSVIVRDGIVVGRGAHQGAGQWHAERNALADAGDAARGAILYCTLEPCNHHGRTPPCSVAIVEAGVARVVYGVADPNPVAGGGAGRLREAGIAVTGGVLADACLDLIWPFVCTEQFQRPYIELKTATSLDGRFAAVDDPTGRPMYLTGPDARRDVHRRRCWVDLVLVGHGTARQDHPRLDTRLADAPADGPRDEPLAGVAASEPPAVCVVARDRCLLFHAVSGAGAPIPGVDLVNCDADDEGRPAPAAIVAAAAARGLHAVMVEGGPRLAASFLADGLVDRWVRYIAPVVLGAGTGWPDANRAAPDRFHHTRSGMVGSDLMSIWDRRDYHAILARLTPEREDG